MMFLTFSWWIAHSGLYITSIRVWMYDVPGGKNWLWDFHQVTGWVIWAGSWEFVVPSKEGFILRAIPPGNISCTLPTIVCTCWQLSSSWSSRFCIHTNTQIMLDIIKAFSLLHCEIGTNTITIPQDCQPAMQGNWWAAISHTQISDSTFSLVLEHHTIWFTNSLHGQLAPILTVNMTRRSAPATVETRVYG